jgi:hypothetical protein
MLPADMPLAPGDPADPAPLVAPVVPLPGPEPELICGPEGDPLSPQLEDSKRLAKDTGTAVQSQRCFMDVRLHTEKEALFCGIGPAKCTPALR